MTSDYDYRWEIADAIQIYRARPARRFLVHASGGYHPTLQLLENGEVAAVARAGDFWVGERGRIEIVLSKDGGESWGQPRPIAAMRPDPCHWAFGQAGDGALLVGFVQPHNYVDGAWDVAHYRFGPLWLIRSTDFGGTWSGPVAVDTSSIPVEGVNPHGKIVRLSDGTLLMGLYGISRDPSGAATFTGRGRAGCYVLRSSDDGRTWGNGSELVGERFVQPAIVELPSGRLLATVGEKDGGQGTWLIESTDRGYSWSAPRPVTGDKENHADLLLLRDGRVLLAYGHRHIPCGVQAMVSHDEGRTWDAEHKIVLASESVYENCGNPSSIQLPDDTIVTAYYVYQSAGPFRHPIPYWVSTGELRGPYAAAIKYRPEDLP